MASIVMQSLWKQLLLQMSLYVEEYSPKSSYHASVVKVFFWCSSYRRYPANLETQKRAHSPIQRNNDILRMRSERFLRDIRCHHERSFYLLNRLRESLSSSNRAISLALLCFLFCFYKKLANECEKSLWIDNMSFLPHFVHFYLFLNVY